MYDTHNSLTAFVGGETVISVTPGRGQPAFGASVGRVQERMGIELEVGIGCSPEVAAAGLAATEALERRRARRTRIGIGADDGTAGS